MTGISSSCAPATLKLWAVPLGGQPSIVTRHVAVLSAEERRRADRFRFETDRRRYILRRAALRGILGAETGVPPEAVRLGADPAYGRPFLVAPAVDGLVFSSSHSGDLALIGVAQGGGFAVDLEQEKPINDFRNLALRFFTATEAAALDSGDESADLARFYRCWVLKEAFIKALGKGLSHPLDSFSIDMLGDPPRLTNAAGHSTGDWHLRLIDIRPGWIGAVARSPTAPDSVSLRFWSFDAQP